MTGNDSRSAVPVLLWVIAIAVLANLGVTVWHLSSHRGPSAAATTDPTSLPAVLDAAERDRLFQEFQARFNEHDTAGLYDLIGRSARLQITHEEMDREAERLYAAFEGIADGAYSHYIEATNPTNQHAYQLVYSARFESETFWKEVVILNVTVMDGTYELIGFRMNTVG